MMGTARMASVPNSFRQSHYYARRMSDLVHTLPRPLYEDIVSGRWLPVVGAGLSMNALVPNGSGPPSWNGLADQLKAELSDPDDTNDAVDIISSYGHEHGRAALVERVARAIRVADAQPAPVHDSLCRLPLDTLITTNFDQLLEVAFRSVSKTCHPVLDENQLAITNPFPGPTLLKIHGDISRPERLVLTEEDFDTYLLRNPLMSTVVASLFAQRSIVLIGYSLSDPDLRQLLALVRERLGDRARAIYSLEVDPQPSKIARFARRHVRVISIPGVRADPAPSLRQLFDEIFRSIGEDAPSRLIPKTHESGLALRGHARRRACFLSATIESQSDYYEWLAPIAARIGVPILGFQDFVAPGDSIVSAIDSMVAASGCAIVEVASAWTQVELGIVINRLGPERILLIQTEAFHVSIPGMNLTVLHKPRSAEEWDLFSERFETWLTGLYGSPEPPNSPVRSHQFIGQVIDLGYEIELLFGDRLQAPIVQRTLSSLIREAGKRGLVRPHELKSLQEFVILRNDVAHGRLRAPDERADKVMNMTRDVIARLRLDDA
jgi:SIR2-like protein